VNRGLVRVHAGDALKIHLIQVLLVAIINAHFIGLIGHAT
jgi:hypothetical protein